MQDEITTLLFIPSLETDGYLTVLGPTRNEANDLVSFFDTQVEASRKLQTNGPVVALLEYFTANLDLECLIEEEGFDELVETLKVSNLPRQRGRRAVFVDVPNNTIAVGTTVVYNKNWAMRGVADPSILGTILDAVNELA